MGGTKETPSGGRGTDPDELSSREWDEAGWDLWIGPGQRLDGLGAVLEALGPLSDAAPNGPTRLADLEDLALLEAPERGRLVLDADALPAEDLGYVRRFLERTTGFELVLVGDQVGRAALRRLSARPCVRWIAWPPDLVELQELCAAPRALAATDDREEPDGDMLVPHARLRDVERATAHDEPQTSAPVEARHAEHVQRVVGRETSRAAFERGLGTEEARELAAIQAVLEQPPLSGEIDEPARGASEQDPFGALDDELEQDIGGELASARELDPFARSHVRTFEEHAVPAAQPRRDEPAGAAAPKAPPGYYRAQVADLADIAQRVDLALRLLRPEPDRAVAPDDGYEPLAAEIARLLQFTRTLSYLVAPPPRGAQTFDFGVLVEEVLDQTVQLGPEAPRCVFRRADGLSVRSDKGLLVQALDAFVVLALSCAGPGELIRVQVQALHDGPGDAHGAARLSLEFPSGPLADLAPERVIEPYALKTRLPSLGANALSAASGIVTGQGGSARLGPAGDGRLELTIDLPLA